MPPKVVAEYAKSNRSSCKKCSNTIAAKALRLGSVTRDSGGFDMTKWHHVDCFPIVSDPVDSAESIQGFSLLQSGDQEALKKLVAKCMKSQEEVLKTDGDEEEVELEGSNSKKIKLSTSTYGEEANLEIVISVSDVKDKYKDATLLPNWKAFQTIIFLELDDGIHDSKKIAAFDFDGCLVKTNVKRVGADAWSLMYSSVPDKLQSLYNDGYKLVIFTNEANIERWKNKRQIAVDSKLGRLNNFIKRVKVPMQVFHQLVSEHSILHCGLLIVEGKLSGKKKMFKKHSRSNCLKKEKIQKPLLPPLTAPSTVFIAASAVTTIGLRRRRRPNPDHSPTPNHHRTAAHSTTSQLTAAPLLFLPSTITTMSLLLHQRPKPDHPQSQKSPENSRNNHQLSRLSSRQSAIYGELLTSPPPPSCSARCPLSDPTTPLHFRPPVFVACGSSTVKAEDPFRKPKHGMWQIMEKYFNSGILIDMDQSFYVGDAAGRENDHSDADIKFAQAVGLKFYVPEEYFGA